MLFGGGVVPKAPMDVHLVTIFVLLCNFLGGGLAAGAFFLSTVTWSIKRPDMLKRKKRKNAEGVGKYRKIL